MEARGKAPRGGGGREEGPTTRFREAGCGSWDADVPEGEIRPEVGPGTAEDTRRCRVSGGGTSRFLGVSKKKQSGKWQVSRAVLFRPGA